MPRYYYHNARDTTESRKRIELSWLKEQNYLGGLRYGNIGWSRNGEKTGDINIQVDTESTEPKIKLSYKAKDRDDDVWKDMDYSFRMESISCRYGGRKWFFVCGLFVNSQYCGRRARILYSTGKYFGCRKCANLTYESSNESGRFRHGVFRILGNLWKADEYYSKIGKMFYRGKPTKKYQRYLKLRDNFSEQDIVEMENKILGG